MMMKTAQATRTPHSPPLLPTLTESGALITLRTFPNTPDTKNISRKEKVPHSDDKNPHTCHYIYKIKK